MRPTPSRPARLALIPAVIALAACGGTKAVHGRVVTVREKDFAISAPTSLHRGAVTLRVENDGPVAHELIVVRAPRGELPLRDDGVTANEEELEPVTLASLEPGPAGDIRTIHLNLAPGHYQLFCNMNGHYRAGMHLELEVS